MLCRLDDIPDGGAIRARGEVDGAPAALMLIRRGDSVYAYVNSCPHIGAPLDTLPGQFLDVPRTHILCSNHGALFRIEDGHCLKGPCAGKDLQAVPVAVEDGAVVQRGPAGTP